MVTFDEASVGEAAADCVAVLDLDMELQALQALDSRAGEILHLVYFANLSRAEVADVLKISIPTVDRELRFARGWLKRKLQLRREQRVT
jgi:DNA-directed RNA polymerase specialized sigma24 family protein